MSERRRTREGGNREEAERRQPDGCVRTNECHECVQCISKQMCRSAVYRAARGMVVGARRLDSLTRCGAEEICVKRRSSSWYKVVGRRVPACYMCAGAKKTFRRSRPHDPPALGPLASQFTLCAPRRQQTASTGHSMLGHLGCHPAIFQMLLQSFPSLYFL